MTQGRPFDDIRALLAAMPEADSGAVARTREHSARQAEGQGRLAALAEWLAAWQQRHPPVADRVVVALFAGSHGIAATAGRTREAAETAARVARLQDDGGAVNQLCKAYDMGLKVFELALELPTRDFTCLAALDETDCAATMAYGMEAIHGGCDLLCLSDIDSSAANTGGGLAARAVARALLAGGGEGGADGGPLVARALEFHKAGLADPLQVLRCLGGREMAAIAGAILGARLQRVPVLLDGPAALAAAAVLKAENPSAIDHCLVAQREPFPDAERLLAHLGQTPLLDLGMALGEGAAAAMAASLVKAAVAVHGI